MAKETLVKTTIKEIGRYIKIVFDQKKKKKLKSSILSILIKLFLYLSLIYFYNIRKLWQKKLQ